MTDFDDAYANAAHIPQAETYPPRWRDAAKAFRAQATGARLDMPYGDAPRERFDLFLPVGRPRGLVVFVHGGYWRAFGKSDWSHFAQGPLARGWAVALPGYTLCPDIRIAGITAQIAQAVTAAAKEIDGPILLTGHSAGGHLVARMGAKGVLPDPLRARLAHILPISPLSDLRPLMQTTMNDDLRIDPAEAQSESPVFQPAPPLPVTVWVGGKERPAFLDQARWLADAWQAAHVVAEGRHHFDVIDPLTDPGSDMVNRLLAPAG